MNEFNVLLAAATNGTPSGSLFDALFARYIAPQESWRELESPLPITFTANGQPLLDYRIYGNTEQSGTPTPENPIMPTGCGERTENLFNPSTTNLDHRVDGSGRIIYDNRNDCSDYIEVESATYYHQYSDVIGYITEYDANKGFVKRATTQMGEFKTSDTTKYIIVSLSKGTYTNYMIVEGQVFPSEYIPYGYQLPLTSAGQGVDIYLGESQTTRRIKKLVLTGEENWGRISGISLPFFYLMLPDTSITGTDIINTHFPSANVGQSTTEIGIGLAGNMQLRVRPDDPTSYTLDSWKMWLSANQLTIWYVLAEPETGLINEPLMKIGDYADTISMEQAGVSIPTAAGETIIDYNPSTTPAVEPEKMYVKYKPQ